MSETKRSDLSADSYLDILVTATRAGIAFGGCGGDILVSIVRPCATFSQAAVVRSREHVVG